MAQPRSATCTTSHSCGSNSIKPAEPIGLCDVPSFPREMIDAFIPPVTPSGRVLKRIASLDSAVVMMRVVLGEQVHPTVHSFLAHSSHPGITSVPIRDLPPSDTALIWLTANRSPKIVAFARTAGEVLAQAEPSLHHWTNGTAPVGPPRASPSLLK